MYALQFVEHGPLPPHERSWRHPSELGPTRADVEVGPPRHLGPLAFGAVAMFAVAAMIVAMTPRSAPGDSLLSATTAPFTSTRPPDEAAVRTVRSDRAVRTVETLPAGEPATGIPVAAILTSFASFPHAVMSSPPLTLDGTDVADELPLDGDLVYVHTDAVTYRLPWSQVPSLAPPDGSMVFDEDNSVVAVVDQGRLLMVAGG
jgi:hypothetical protein